MSAKALELEGYMARSTEPRRERVSGRAEVSEVGGDAAKGEDM